MFERLSKEKMESMTFRDLMNYFFRFSQAVLHKKRIDFPLSDVKGKEDQEHVSLIRSSLLRKLQEKKLQDPQDKSYDDFIKSLDDLIAPPAPESCQGQTDTVQGLPVATVTDVQKNQGTEEKSPDTEDFIEMVLVQEVLEEKGDIQKLGDGIQEGVSDITEKLKEQAEDLQKAIQNVSHATEKTIEPALQSIKAASQDLEKTAKSLGKKALEMTSKTLTIIADFCLHLLRIVPTCFKKISLEFGHFIPNCKKVGLPAAMVGFLAGLISFAPSAFVQEFKDFKNSSKETIKSEKDHFGIFLARHHKLLHKDMESMQGVLKEWKHAASAQNAEEPKDVSKQTFSLACSFNNVPYELRRRAFEFDADGAAVSRGPQSRKP